MSGVRLREVRDDYAEYTVYDERYERIGRVTGLFVDAEGRERYIGVKMGVLGTRSTLIPMSIVRVNDRRRLVEVGAPKSIVEDAPHLDEGGRIPEAYERRILDYFDHYRIETLPNVSDFFSTHAHEGPVDTEFGERAEPALHPPPEPAAPEPRDEGNTEGGTRFPAPPPGEETDHRTTG